jgi:hypothetical protein
MADQEQQEVFDAARETEDELLKGTFEAEQPQAEEAERPTRARNADGTFARTQPEQPAEQPAEQSAEQSTEQPAKPEEEELLPSWRAREINEERRRVQAENDAIRAEYARAQARLAQIEQAQQRAQQPAPELIDPVLDPKGFVKQFTENLTSQFEQRMQSMALTNNLEVAHVRYGETFEKAYEAVLTQGQRGNNALVRQLVTQPNPGEAIVRWYNDALIRSEVGNDLAGFRKKEREALLEDETFLQEASERLRQRALGGQNGQPPNTVVKLPPSLTRATGSADQSTASNDGSEEALFAYAMNSKRR